MYKYAQEVASAVPAGQMPGATSVPGAVSMKLGSSGRDNSRRPVVAAAAAIGGLIVIVFLLALLVGSCSGDGGSPAATEEASSVAGALGEATAVPTREARPTEAVTPVPTPASETGEGPAVDATTPPESGDLLVLYQVQEGEALLKIAETFGVTRRSILKANEGMQDSKPYVQAGDIIVVPVSPELSIEQIEETIPGYQGLAP